MAANDEILKRTLQHQVYVHRYATGLVARMAGLLDDSASEVLTKLIAGMERVVDRGGVESAPDTAERLNKLLAAIESTRDSAYEALHSDLEKELIQFSEYEAEHEINVLENAMPVRVQFASPPVAQLHAVVASRPFQGRFLRNWVKDLAGDEFRGVQDEIRKGMIQGESMLEISNRVSKRLQVSKVHADTITRTAVSHVSNRARGEVAKANQDLIKGLKIVATLDSRTSTTCRHKDGKLLPPDSKDLPPYHHRCRTAYIMVTKSWKELGIDLEDAPPGTRAALNGQVPEDMTYYEWLKEASKTNPEVAVAALGPKKAELFLNGGKAAIKFENNAGVAYTLDELKQREPAAWRRAFGGQSPEVERSYAVGYVKSMGASNHCEYAHAYDMETGERLLQKKGRARSVPFTPGEVALLRRSGAAEMLHNHPSGSTLSGADLQFAASANLRRITAVPSKGAGEYTAVPLVGPVAMGQAHAYAESMFDSLIRPRVESGVIKSEYGNRLLYHLVNQALHIGGAIHYRYELDPITAKAMDLYGEPFKPVVGSVGDWIKTWTTK